jgi:hypothetical protein
MKINQPKVEKDNAIVTCCSLNLIKILIIAITINRIAISTALAGGSADTVQWINVKSLDVHGQGWKEDSTFYGRLPLHARGVVPDAVWNLGKQSAGLYIVFKTDAPYIRARWTLSEENLSYPHFAATGVSGLDLYVMIAENGWHWIGLGRPRNDSNLETLVEGIPSAMREYRLYLPLYNGIKNLEIGIPKNCTLENCTSGHGKPIVFYGTSIIQGGCASRPGMCTTAILGRRLQQEIINLGFSGRGRMEPEMARILAELNPEIYFIDCLPNLQADEVAQRVEPFVRILRQAHPETPIVLAEGVTYNDAFLVTSRQLRNTESRQALRKAYDNLMNSGVRNLYYQIAEGQLGNDGEGTVDGTHPTDLGFIYQSAVYGATLESILEKLK